METCGEEEDHRGRVPGRHIKDGSPTAGADSEDRGMAIGAPLNFKWDGVRGAGMEVMPLPALWN